MSRPKKSRPASVERFARALWELARVELVTGGTMPPFRAYADGAQEPPIWEDASEVMRRYWLRRAKRLLVLAAPHPETR